MNKELKELNKLIKERKKDFEVFKKDHPDAVTELFEIKFLKKKKTPLDSSMTIFDKNLQLNKLDLNAFDDEDWDNLKEIKMYLQEHDNVKNKKVVRHIDLSIKKMESVISKMKKQAILAKK
jgi:hypothetical protein